jgi:hypothetical protein
MMDNVQHNVHVMNPSSGTEEVSETLGFNSKLTPLISAADFNKFILRESFKYCMTYPSLSHTLREPRLPDV